MKTVIVLTMAVMLTVGSVNSNMLNEHPGSPKPDDRGQERYSNISGACHEYHLSSIHRSFWQAEAGSDDYGHADIDEGALLTESREHLEIGYQDAVYFYMDHNACIELEVYDITGRKVVSERGEYAAGMHNITLQQGSGLYFVKVSDQSYERLGMVMKLR